MSKRMELHGSLVTNLAAATDSARRHRNKPVYPDTLRHWSDLVGEARKVLATVIDVDSAAVRRLADALDVEIVLRG
jgi:hypothetical protein